MDVDRVRASMAQFLTLIVARMEARNQLIADGLVKFHLLDDDEEALKEILRALGDVHPLRNVRDVLDCFWEHFPGLISRESGSSSSPEILERILAGLVSGLANPMRPFSFCVPISDESPVLVLFEIGGPQQLRVEEDGARPHRVTLKGTVDAPTVTRAIYGVEEVLQQLMGTALSLEIAGFRSLPPGHGTSFTIDISPNLLGDQIMLSPRAAESVDRFFFRTPDLSEFESKRADSRGLETVMERAVGHLRTLFCASSPRAAQIRNAAALYLNCLSAREYGAAVSNAFMCLEAILLEDTKADILARLKEAVAYRIGTSADDRKRWRRRVGELYDQRSKYVHTGEAREKTGDRESLWEMVGQILKKEIEDF